MEDVQMEQDLFIHFKMGGKDMDSHYIMLEHVKSERGYSNKYVIFEKEWKSLKAFITEIDRTLSELNDVLCLPGKSVDDSEQQPVGSDHHMQNMTEKGINL